MDRLDLEIWREASRASELQVSLQQLARLMAKALALDFVLLHRLEGERKFLRTAALSVIDPGRDDARLRLRHAFDAEHYATFCRWAEERQVLRLEGRSSSHPLAALLPEAGAGSFLLGPLWSQSGLLGLVVVHVHQETGVDEARLQAWLEPLAVALDNDLRFDEMLRLREALEADKRALLSRLERQEISEAIVGESAGLRLTMERVEQVAPTDAPVLILGETGSGKEVVARAIHQRSRRAKGPIVRVNCGAIPSELVDSELFGHEKGSFTGALHTRRGWFERADGGTLFLDEIGELPLAAQVRLLRVLQEGSLERVGGQRPIDVDVRIVAATHRHLEVMVTEGSFREDLWYRIGVFPIRIPALRERRQDIPELATHFAARAGLRLGAGPLVPSPRDIDILVAYDWPGNVRELAAVIERAAILGNGRRLEIATALGSGAPRLEDRSALSSRPAPAAPVQGEAFLTLDEAMARHIESALRRCAGRIEGAQGAAKLLGINPHTLRARMRKLGVAWAHFREPNTSA